MKLDQLKSKCTLCPHNCELALGEQGKCLIRRGSFLEPFSNSIGFQVSTIALEPLAKKPMLHFMPDSMTLSIGGYGCSMSCDYCQNWKVSQQQPNKIKRLDNQEIIQMAKDKGVKVICFTYNEPTLYYPFLINLYKQLKKEDMYLVIKTNAYVAEKYWREICDHVDAMNIDYKGSEKRHMDMMGIREGTYETILKNIQIAIESKAHVEISIPVFEDYSWEDIDPIKTELTYQLGVNDNIPIHFLRVFPVNRLKGKPTEKDKIQEAIDNFNKFTVNRPLSNKIHIHNIYGK